MLSISILLFLLVTIDLHAQDAKKRLYDLYQETEAFEDSLRDASPDSAFTVDSIEERNEQYQYWTGVLERINSIERDSLELEHQISYDLFKRDVQWEVRDHEFGAYLVPLNHEGGFHTRIVGTANYANPQTVEEYEEYIARLRSVNAYFEANMKLMRQGLEKGHTLPKKVLSQDYNVMMTSQIYDDATQSDFYGPFESFPSSISDQQKQRLREEGRAAIEEAIIPAYETFLSFMNKEYRPNARTSIATKALPGGEEYYNFLVNYYTTLEVTPKEVHNVGLDEVKRIRSEMEAIIDQVNFEGSFEEFLNFLRTDPQFYVEEPEQLMKEAAYIAKRMDGKLPELFNMLPRQPYGIEPVPDHLAPRYTGGRYSPSSGERDAGYYWVNTYDLKSRPLYTLEALTFHEAAPGHHLQIALARELDDLPEIRRQAGVTAFVEGWALYAERLGLEAGFYQDPYQQLWSLDLRNVAGLQAGGRYWHACVGLEPRAGCEIYDGKHGAVSP
ncbi:MAG: DUF885 domain-containing protein [Balneolaceae bacterium]|nr:DUF885 domain-containing protein [Balneolaceae bacterium]